MTAPGERRPRASSPDTPAHDPSFLDRLRPRSLAAAVAEAVAVGLLSAAVWALVKGVLEFPGVLAVAVVAGWAIGALLWQVRGSPALAALIAAGAWLVGLVLTWLVAMAILPGSSRTFLERVEGTPFVDWLMPQFGPIELLGLILYLGAALYGARPRSP
ncbi:MAG: hypothetical protein PVG27_03155 [Chloroflexota bacterium]|jgi:hypothetical protein